jgi:hypothetical protein
LELANIMISAMGAAIVMCDRVYREEGLLVKVYSDRGPQFVSRIMKDLWPDRSGGKPEHSLSPSD